MSNDYYNASSLISTLSKASSKFVNAALSAIAAGFEKLPGEAALKQNRVNFATDTGTANAKTMTLTHAISSYVDGAALAVKIGEANTGACTMDWGPGARSVVHVDGSAMQPGDLGALKIRERLQVGDREKL